MSGIAISRRGPQNPVTDDILELSNEKKIPGCNEKAPISGVAHILSGIKKHISQC
jgi:hypothetical protein